MTDNPVPIAEQIKWLRDRVFNIEETLVIGREEGGTPESIAEFQERLSMHRATLRTLEEREAMLRVAEDIAALRRIIRCIHHTMDDTAALRRLLVAVEGLKQDYDDTVTCLNNERAMFMQKLEGMERVVEAARAWAIDLRDADRFGSAPWPDKTTRLYNAVVGYTALDALPPAPEEPT